MVFEGHFQQYI